MRTSPARGLLGALLAATIAGVASVASVVVVGQQASSAPDQRERGGAPIRLRAATFVPTRGQTPSLPAGVARGGAPRHTGYYLVQFEGPIRDAWKAELTAAGADLIEYVPDFTFKVRMNADAAARAERLAPVVWVGPYLAAYKLAPELVRSSRALYDVRLERGANAPGALAAIAAVGAQVVRRNGARLSVAADAAQLDALAEVADVATIDNLMPHQKHNEYGAGAIVGSASANAAGFDGSTQTIAVADTGLGNGSAGNAHAHLPASRIAAIFNWPGSAGGCFDTVVNDGALDVDTGHGTHTATTAVGGGGLAGEGRGAAPGASLVFQAVENYAVPSLFCTLFYGLTDGYYLTGIPADLGALFRQAYNAGARIHADSWGSNAAGAYTQDSADTDAFVWAHPDMTITFSAGNAGVDFNVDGVVDTGSVNAPATAKNVISVGASENDRGSHWECDATLTYTNCAALGGQNTIFTYGGTWPANFPANPLRDDPSAGDREQMAAFSSRGPASDGRIKPDVVAPGTWMLSGYSDKFQQQYDPAPNPQNGLYQYHGWGNPLNRHYKYMGGTSMANPLVAGASAVVRDFYEKSHAHQASAALVKATLINSAVDLLDENNDGVYDNAAPIPNMHEGWGRVDLQGATDPGRRFAERTTGIATAASASFAHTVSGAGWPFRVTLAWTDYASSPAAAVNLVNDLDLRVTAPNGDVHLGNVFAFGATPSGGSPDRINNVENVFLAAADAGTWTIEVVGYNVPNGPQPFALVVSGQFEGPDAPTALVTVTATDPAASESGPSSGTFRLVRSGGTSDTLNVLYGVTGSAVPGTDYAALSGTATIAAGDTEVTVEIVPVNDTAIEPDETVVLTLRADAAYRVGGPSAAVVTIVSEDVPPDLSIASVTAPAAGGAGDHMTVTYVTRNQGAGPAPDSETGLYLSANVLWEPADVQIDRRGVAALNPGATATTTFDVEIPVGTAAGTYYLIAHADIGGALTETQENNNARASGAVRIGPDLYVSAVTVPLVGGAGESIAVTDTIRNQGGGDAPPSQVAFYLSANTLFDAPDIQIGTRPAPAIAAGGFSTVTTALAIPAATPVGTYYVLGIADSTHLVGEANENNNLKVGGQVKVGTDLIVTAVSAASSGGAGYPLSITVTTKNQGGGIAPASATSFYLSVDSTLDGSDVLFGARTIPELAPGISDSGTTSVTIPTSVATATYFVIAKADGTGTVPETTENNNTRYSAQVKVGPDLVVTAFSGTGTAAPGGWIAVTDTTKNQGAGLAAASRTAFYLSADTLLDAADMRVGDRAVPSLTPGGLHSITTSVPIPATVGGGTYYLISKADADNEVPEPTSISNVGPFFTIRIGPDLTVQAVSAPLNAGAGLSILVTDTTRNLGYGPVDQSNTGFYLSTNAALDAADLLLGSRPVPALGIGGVHSASTTLTIPVTATTGQYYIIARADVDKAISEISETNNTSYASVRVGPDLTITALTLPLSATAGSTATATNTTKNAGGGPVGPSSTRFYLSANSTLDGSDLLLDSRMVTALDGGASDTAATPLSIPATTAPGTYFVIAKADGDGTVVEVTETNNTRVASFGVNAAP